MIRTRTVTAATATILAFSVSGCGGFLASSMSETVTDVAAGSNAEAGSMLVRNAFVLGPPPDAEIPRGGRAAVYLSLYNRGADTQTSGAGGATDRLVEVSAGETARGVLISGGAIEVPPGQVINVSQGSGRVVLRELTRSLSGGESIRLTLRFERAGAVTFHVPVMPQEGSYATLSPFPSSPSPGPTGTASPAEAGQSPSPGDAGPSPEETPTSAAGS